MAWLREGWRLENGETGERDPGQAEENRKGGWAATRNQVTSAKTTLLSTDPFVTLASQRWRGQSGERALPQAEGWEGRNGSESGGERLRRARNCTVEWRSATQWCVGRWEQSEMGGSDQDKAGRWGFAPAKDAEGAC